MRAKRSIKDSLKEYLNWCVSRLLLGGSRNDTVRDMVDAISDEIASGGGVVSQDQLDQTVQDITKSYGIADQTVLTSAEQYTDQKIADVVDGSPEALDTLYELAKALGDDQNFATTVMDQIGQKLPTTTFENFIDNKAWTKDNLTQLSQLINNIHSIKAGTRVESMDVNLASMSSYLRYDLFDANTTGTKPGNLTTGFLLTFSWDNGGWGAQIAISKGNIDGAIFLRTIKDSESDKIWGPWVKVWNSNNFNPDDYLPKTTPNVNGGIIINGETTVGYRPYLKFHIPGVNYSQFVMDENGTVHLLNGSEQTPRTYKPLKAGPIFSNGNRVWDSGNFNPDSKLNYSEFGGDLDTISTSGMYRLLSGCTNIPLGSSQGCFLLHTNWDANAAQQMYFVYSTTDIYIRNKVGGTWNPWQKVWNAGNFNPDSKFPYLGMGGVNDNSNEIGAGYSGSSAGGNFNGPFIKFGQTSNYMTELYNRHDQDVFQIRRMVNGEWQPFVSLWHSGNLGNATTSKAGLMSAADKTKLDGLSGGGLNIPAYIFPGDPSKLDNSASPTTITSILGTASDFLDAFNNGKVFVSKTVTFSGVSIPSDITYNVLKSEDPDTPTIFQIIMCTIIWSHYIEVTIDFENNEYQAITGTINGRISVNTTSTSN
jgi:hypothetical protein